MNRGRGWRFQSLPLGIQMIGLAAGTLLIAQITTLALTLLLPPAPAPRWDMAEVVRGLTHPEPGSRLDRAVLEGPPNLSGEGWLISPLSRRQLARQLGRQEDEVLLAFYTALPVGGVAIPAADGSPLSAGDRSSGLTDLLIPRAYAQRGPGGPGAGSGGGPGGGSGPGPGPGAGPGVGPGHHGSFGDGPGSVGVPAGGTSRERGDDSSGLTGAPRGVPANGDGRASSSRDVSLPGRFAEPGRAGPPGLPAPPAALIGGQPLARTGAIGPESVQLPGGLDPDQTRPLPRAVPLALPSGEGPPARASTIEPPNPGVAVPLPTTTASESVQPGAVRRRLQDLPFRRGHGALAEALTPPFIDGDFVAGLRRPDGRWVVVAPRAESFPNRWQRRVALWFALSLAIAGPAAWWFARGIVRPLERFAHAAERLGRDPSAEILPLLGPAEIGRTARAFNQMRARIAAFVNDRAAVVGAISHDLRTPLTRLRFRIEKVPAEQRDGLLGDVVEMEGMITQVLAYIRDGSAGGPRQPCDLVRIAADAIAANQVTGGQTSLVADGLCPVEVDPVGIRRVIDNLIDNAVKYGGRAELRFEVAEALVMLAVVDAGPGVPQSERERVFEPFYRGAEAIGSGMPGSGLGLAVCRSISRAHGGDVVFADRLDGFATVLTLPRLDGRNGNLAA